MIGIKELISFSKKKLSAIIACKKFRPMLITAIKKARPSITVKASNDKTFMTSVVRIF